MIMKGLSHRRCRGCLSWILGGGVPIKVRHFDSLVQIERAVYYAFTLQLHQSLNLYAKGYHVQLDMMQRATTFVAK